MTSIYGTDRSAGRQLAGKVALVTGGNRGIGKAIAARLAALGAAVAICGRDSQTLATTARELQAVGTPIHSQRADVTKSSDVDALIKETETALGAISILVNNAGMGLFGPVQEKTEQEWDTLMNTNLKSVFLVSRQVIPGMIQRKSGDIINISSLAGKSTFAGGGIYCASKWALQVLRHARAETLQRPFRCAVDAASCESTFSRKRTDVDDVAGLALNHPRNHLARDEKHALQVRVHQSVPLLFCFFLDGPEKTHPSVIDKNADCAEGGFCFLDQGIDIGRLCDVGALRVNGSAHGLKFPGGGCERLGIAA